MKRGFAALAALGLAGACTLTTDLDGFSSGGALDAGPKPGDAGPSATTDGAVVPMDGAAAEASVRACPDKPIALCEEFEGDETKNGWTVSQGGGATIGPATVPWGERGLVVTVPKATTGPGPAANWEKTFTTTVSKMSFDVDLEYDQRPVNDGEYHNTFGVRLVHGDTYNIIYVSIATGAVGWAVQDFPSHPNNIDYRVVPITPAERHHVRFEIEASGSSRFIVDGVTVADNPAPAYVFPGQPTIFVGVTVSDVPATPMTMGYAHLVFTAE